MLEKTVKRQRNLSQAKNYFSYPSQTFRGEVVRVVREYPKVSILWSSEVKIRFSLTLQTFAMPLYFGILWKLRSFLFFREFIFLISGNTGNHRLTVHLDLNTVVRVIFLVSILAPYVVTSCGVISLA